MNSKERRELEEKEFIELMTSYGLGRNMGYGKLNLESEFRHRPKLHPLDLEFDYFSIESEDNTEENYRLIS